MPVTDTITIDARSVPMNRTEYSCSLGIDVDTMDVTIYPRVGIDTLAGATIQAAFAGGLLDSATIQIYRLFYTSPTNGGGILLMNGKAGDVEIDRSQVKITVNTFSDLFGGNLPRNVYQAQCYFSVYGDGCLVDRATWTTAGTVTAGGLTYCGINVVQADGYYRYGVITFTSGPNDGFSYSIQWHVSNIVYPLIPFVSAPQIGDTFTVTAGCDHTYDGGCTKLGNQEKYPGMPYIPPPTTTASQPTSSDTSGGGK